jgi:hypothetical protein
MLMLFCEALVAFHLALTILLKWGSEFKAFWGGMKCTLRNLSLRLHEL